MLSVITRFVTETVGLYLSYWLQTKQTKETGWLNVWNVPDKYICTYGTLDSHNACSQDTEIPCWISRPREKTIIIRYLLVVQLFLWSL